MNRSEQIIITEGLFDLPEDQSLSYLVEKILFEVFDEESDRKLIRQVKKQYKDMIGEYRKLLKKSKILPPKSSEHKKMFDHMDELKTQIDSHERDFHVMLDLKKDWQKVKDPIIAKKYKIAIGASIFALILAGIAYGIYCNRSDKCRKFEGKDYRKCRMEAIDSTIKELKSKMKECPKSGDPEKCKEKIQDEIEKWEVKKRKEILIYSVLK